MKTDKEIIFKEVFDYDEDENSVLYSHTLKSLKEAIFLFADKYYQQQNQSLQEKLIAMTTERQELKEENERLKKVNELLKSGFKFWKHMYNDDEIKLIEGEIKQSDYTNEADQNQY